MSSAGVAGQQRLDISAALEATKGILDLSGYTVARTHLCVLVESAAGETASVQTNLWLGIGVFPTGMAAGTFPDLSAYEGDWYAYECMIFRTVGTQLLAVAPESASVLRADYKSMRKIPNGERCVLVAQIAQTIDLLVNVSVSTLYLMP